MGVGLFYLSTFFFSFMLAVSTTSLLMVWVGMELLGFSFICWVLSFEGLNNMVCKTKVWTYFLIQSCGSIVILFNVTLNLSESESLLSVTLFNPLVLSFMTVISLMMKLALPPFHEWAMGLSENMNWVKMCVMLTLQKFFPLMLSSILVSVSFDLNFLMILGTLSSVLGTLGSIEVNIRRFLVYSSILNTGWMLVGFSMGDFLGWGFYIFYSLSLFMVLLLFNSNFVSSEFKDLNDLVNKSNKTLTPVLSVVLLFMMSMPPSPGFFMKLKMCSYAVGESSAWLGLVCYFSTMVLVVSYMYLFFPLMLNSATSFGSRITYSVSLLWAMGFVFLFTIGGWKFI